MTLFFGSIAVASRDSYQETAIGLTQLQHGDDQAAVERFKSATMLDPQDSQAWLFLGVAFNQLGKSQEALDALNKASELGIDDSEILFQTGRARLGIGDFRGAIESLLRFESLKPGRGQTSEFLGRAYLGLGDRLHASEAFTQALLRDPGLRSTVLPCQAQIAQEQMDSHAVWQNLDDLRWYAGDSQTNRAVHDEIADSGLFVDDLEKIQPLNISLSFATGYTSRVLGLESVSVQGDLEHNGSSQEEFAATASYAWSNLIPTRTGQSPDHLVVSGSIDLDDYPVANYGNFLSTLVSAEYTRPIAGRLSGSLSIASSYDALAWRGFRDDISGRAALQWHTNNWLLIEAGYTGARDDYLYEVPAVQDPDAISQTFSLDSYINFTKTGTDVDKTVIARIGGFFLLNRADGSDFNYNGGGIVAGLDFPLFQHIRGHLLYTWTEDRYLDINSATVVPSDYLHLAYKRNDYANTISLRFSRQIRELSRHLTVFAAYDYTENSSNIQSYRFSQHTVRLGVTWDL